MKRIEAALNEVCERPNEAVQADAPFRDIKGWDSMRAVSFQLELESLFSVDLSEEAISGSFTLSDVAAILRSKGIVLD